MSHTVWTCSGEEASTCGEGFLWNINVSYSLPATLYRRHLRAALVLADRPNVKVWVSVLRKLILACKPSLPEPSLRSTPCGQVLSLSHDPSTLFFLRIPVRVIVALNFTVTEGLPYTLHRNLRPTLSGILLCQQLLQKAVNSVVSLRRWRTHGGAR